MADDESIPAFADNWMEGLIDRPSLVRPVIRARNELRERSEPQVRELASRLDAGIKSWKLKQGVPIAEVLKLGAPALRRGYNPAAHMSDMEIILETQEYELFGHVTDYPQRIAIYLLKAAARHDFESVLSATVALNEFYWKLEQERLEIFRGRRSPNQ